MLEILTNNKPINRLGIIAVFIILILLAVIVFLSFKYVQVQEKLRVSEEGLRIRQINEKILDFSDIFINDVLKAKEEIGFETRLKLENTVRGIGDDEIFTQWQKFVESKTENEAQEQVKNLLDLLVKKVRVK